MTYAAFVDYIEAVTIAGAVHSYTSGPPNALSTADLPASWCELPSGQARPAYVGGVGGNRTMRLTHVYALEPVAQNTQGVNYDAAIAALDTLHTAFAAATTGLDGPLTWSSRIGTVAVANVAYWAIITELEGLG